MVSAVDNLTRVGGTIIGRSPLPNLPDWDLVTLSLDRVEDVPNRANLVSAGVGDSMEICVRRAILGDARVGWRLNGRVRLAASGLMAESYPAAGDWQLTPSA